MTYLNGVTNTTRSTRPCGMSTSSILCSCSLFPLSQHTLYSINVQDTTNSRWLLWFVTFQVNSFTASTHLVRTKIRKLLRGQNGSRFSIWWQASFICVLIGHFHHNTLKQALSCLEFYRWHNLSTKVQMLYEIQNSWIQLS